MDEDKIDIPKDPDETTKEPVTDDITTKNPVTQETTTNKTDTPGTTTQRQVTVQKPAKAVIKKLKNTKKKSIKIKIGEYLVALGIIKARKYVLKSIRFSIR